MKIHLFYILLAGLFLFTGVPAQDLKMEEARSELSVAGLKALADRMHAYYPDNLDSVAVLAERVIAAAVLSGDRELEADAYYMLGRCEYYQKNYETSILHSKNSLRIYRELGNLSLVSALSRYIGDAFKYSYRPDSAEFYALQAIAAAEQIPDSSEIVRAYNDLGLLFYRTGDYISSVRNYLKAIDHIRNPDGGSRIYNNLGGAYYKMHDYANSLQAHRLSEDLNKKGGRIDGEVLALANIGRVYREMQQYEDAEDYLRRAVGLSRSIDYTHGLAWSYMLLGQVMTDLGRQDSAYFMYRKSYDKYAEMGSADGMGQVLINIARLQEVQGLYSEAVQSLRESLALLKDYGSIPDYAEAFFHLAVNQVFLQQYDEAGRNLDSTLSLCGSSSMFGLASEAYLKKAELEMLRKGRGPGNEYLISALNMKDSIIRKNSEFYVNVLTLRSEVETIRRENDHLRNRLDIERLKLSGIKTQRRYGLTLLVFVILGLAVTVRYSRIIIRKNRELEEYSEQMDRTNSELTEAMNNVKELKGLLPICANCKNIRDDAGYWSTVEEYIGHHTDVNFTHGLCPDCARELYPEFMTDADKKK